MCAQSLSCVQLFSIAWTVAHQAPLSVGFSRQEYWSGLPCLLQGICPTQGLNPHLLSPAPLSHVSPELVSELFTV